MHGTSIRLPILTLQLSYASRSSKSVEAPEESLEMGDKAVVLARKSSSGSKLTLDVSPIAINQRREPA
jgi:hypothetical protein